MAGLRTNALVAGGVDADLGSSAKRPMPDGRKSTSRLEPLPPRSLLDGPSGKADVVIWISPFITEEHAAALEWLSENTVVGVGFFGVELELLRIGESLPAPHFKLVVRPNEWTKKVRPGTDSAVAWSWETYASELHVPQGRIEVGDRLVQAIVAAVEGTWLALAARDEQGIWRFPVTGRLQRPRGRYVLLPRTR